ncbi:MAG: SRPBCC domain-containing protein [Rhodobacteraceae bacterium]|nr:SRPBCC domain-containing protein [Paracoccaceae bacterium]
MADVTLERDFAVTPEKLFAAVSTPEGLASWWGPENVTLDDLQLDFTRTGPWRSTMIGTDGQRYKVTGQVTHVDPPKSVGLTWAWHDDADDRGPESHVTFTVQAHPGGARLIVDHRGLADEDQAGRHTEGWTSSLRKIAAALAG